jgi:ABC-type branched-subunit amino acid transport system substrate-binding protein
VIGIHAPITGAAPLPNSFKAASQVYPEWINSKGGVHGRKVRVEVVDDQYTPSTAVQKCTELVQKQNAFLLIGGGGTDQIQACARQAAQLGVPYLSAGVTEIGLNGLPNYFAVSMSYPAQGPYLAKFMQSKFPSLFSDVAMVYSNTRNFTDARDGFVSGVESLGGSVREYQMSRNPSNSELANTATQMCADGVKMAYPLMAPTSWLFLAGQADQVCQIQWSGVGLTMGLNAVASPGCRANRSIEGATFFSPFPGVDRAPAIDPEFAQAVQGKSWDDIYVALWASTKATVAMIEKVGPDLTRGAFVQTAQNVKNLSSGMNPPLTFSPEDHFGADVVHILQANCDQQVYVTLDTFKKF